MVVSRIHSHIIQLRSLDAVVNAMDRMQKLQEKLATGLEINRLSDDPVGVGVALNYATEMRKNDYYVQSINSGINNVKRVNTELQNAERILFEIRDLAVEAGEVSVSSSERQAIALGMENLLKELIDTANSKTKGKFIFGGTETLSGSQPLAKPFNEQFNTDGWIDEVLQNPRGINNVSSHLVQDASQVEIRLSGGAFFQPNGEGNTGDIFNDIITLRDAVLNNQIDIIRASVDTIDAGIDNIIDYESVMGARINRLEITTERIEQAKLYDTERYSEIMDADMAEVAIKFGSQQIAYQASLEAASKSMQQSLLDFV